MPSATRRDRPTASARCRVRRARGSSIPLDWHTLRQSYLWHILCRMRLGFTATAVAFFSELEADNTREHWQTTRGVYDDLLRPTFDALLAALGGNWRVYRPHNDTRFARLPYKTFLGAVTEGPDGVGAFVRVGAQGLLVGTGMPQPAADQLARLRAAIAEDDSGQASVEAMSLVSATDAHVHGGRWTPLTRTPRGWPANHPRATWLRWKGVEVTHRPGSPDWLDSAEAPQRIRRLFQLGAPLHRWLAAHVGPSALTAEQRFSRARHPAGSTG